MSLLRGSLLAVALVPLGCVVRYNTVQPVAHTRGAALIDCPSYMVDTHPLGNGSYVSRGCNREVRMACVVASNYQVNCFRDDPPEGTQKIVVASPVQTAKPAEPELDRLAVRAALQAVSYQDCKGSGEAKLHLTLNPDGSVTDVRIASAKLDAAAAACVVSRFQSVRVPQFKGKPRTIAWTIELRDDHDDDDDDATPAPPKPVAM